MSNLKIITFKLIIISISNILNINLIFFRLQDDSKIQNIFEIQIET